MLNFLAPLISGGLSLLGGHLGNQAKAEGQNKEIELQKEFAQNGLRWKVEDAQRAGVHPLAALGASGASYTPVGLGDNDTAASFSSAGQDFSRAIEATSTTPERAGAYGQKIEALTLDRMGLENQLLRAQIMRTTQPANPPFPLADTSYEMPGQPGSGVKVAGMDVRQNPGWSEAQKISDIYGELGEWLYGVPKIGADMWHNATTDDGKKPWVKGGLPGLLGDRQTERFYERKGG